MPKSLVQNFARGLDRALCIATGAALAVGAVHIAAHVARAWGAL